VGGFFIYVDRLEHKRHGWLRAVEVLDIEVLYADVHSLVGGHLLLVALDEQPLQHKVEDYSVGVVKFFGRLLVKRIHLHAILRHMELHVHCILLYLLNIFEGNEVVFRKQFQIF